MDATQQALEAISRFNDTVRQRMEQAESKTSDQDVMLSANKATLISLALWRQNVIAELAKIEDTLLDLREDLDPLDPRILALEGAVSTINKTLTTFNTSLGALQTDNATNKDNIGKLQTSVGTAQTQVKSLQDDNTVNKTNISANATDLAGLKTTVGGHTTDIASLKAGTKVNTDDIAALKQTTATHTTDIGTLKQTTATHTTDIASLKQTATAQGTDVATLKQNDTTRATDIATLKQSDATQNTDIATLKQNDATRATDLAAMKASLTVTAWSALTLGNRWAAQSAAEAPSYRKAHGYVELNGTMITGTAASTTTVATLPLGFRPAELIRVPVTYSYVSNSRTYYGSFLLEIATTGVITIYAPASSYTAVFLDNIRFLAA